MIRRVLRILLALFCFFNLFLMPRNKYEWMADEQVQALPIDDNEAIYKGLVLLPIICLGVLSFFINGKSEKIVFWVLSGVLLTLYFFKYL